MKKRVYATSLILTLGLLSACATEPKSEKTPIEEPEVDVETPAEPSVEVPDDKTNEEQQASEKENDLTQQEVLSAIKEQLTNTDLEKILPTKLPVQDNQHLTATTSSKPTSYQVNFYATDEPIPINNEALLDEGMKEQRVAILKVRNEKNSPIIFEDFSKVGGEEVDLGYGITGYQDAGVGNLWTSWNEGRWQLMTHTSIDQLEKGVALGKQAVEYLETHSLPIPKQHGILRLDATGDNHSALWEKDDISFELSEVQSAEDLLDIIVTFE